MINKLKCFFGIHEWKAYRWTFGCFHLNCPECSHCGIREYTRHYDTRHYD